MTVSVDLVVALDRCQTRAEASEEHIADLIEVLDAGNPLPPIDVVELTKADAGLDVGTLVVVDGFHRYTAHRRFGATRIAIKVVAKGTVDDAARLSLGANSDPRGLRRSADDKRKAVTMAFAHPLASGWSTSKIAELCSVSSYLVTKMREAASPVAVERAAVAAKAAKAVAANPGASSREVAAAAGVSHKAARTALAKGGGSPVEIGGSHPPKAGVPPVEIGGAHPGKAPSVPQEHAEVSDGPTPVQKPPTQAMLDRAAALPHGAPDPLPLLRIVRAMDACRQAISADVEALPLLGVQTTAFSDKWRTLRYEMESQVPVPCPKHEGDKCQWCAGRGWVRTSMVYQIERVKR